MKDLLQLFAALEVEYVIVGGYAVNHYGYVRNTQDIDLLIRPSTENAGRVMEALREFGFGGAGIPQEAPSCRQRRRFTSGWNRTGSIF